MVFHCEVIYLKEWALWLSFMSFGWIQIKKGMQLEPSAQVLNHIAATSGSHPFGWQLWGGGGNQIESQKPYKN